MRKSIISGMVLAGLSGLSGVVQAQTMTQYCTGTVQVLVNNVGAVMVFGSWRNDWTEVCNLNSAFGVVQPTTCKAWYSSLLAAYSMQKPVTVYYDAAPAACAALPTYGNSVAPQYITDNN